MLDLQQKQGLLLELMQEMEEGRWSDMGEEGGFSSVRVFVLLPGAKSNCVSGLNFDFGLKGWDVAERSDGAACSPTASCGFSGSFC